MENINLLFLADVIRMNGTNLVNGKELYQLKKTGEDTYNLSPFEMLVCKGKLNEYLEENNITLCYKIDESDKQIIGIFDGMIKNYEINDDGELVLYKPAVLKKNYAKRNLS